MRSDPAEPLLIEADPVRLAQVLANLLNNAAKYTEEGGQIWLCSRREGDEVVVSVRDTGTGIPSEMLPRVFDLFTQIDRTLGRAQGGLGIGLALVKKLVHLHGGAVEAKSAGPGQGSEFVVRLPLLRAEGENHVEETRVPDNADALFTGQRILVIDDNHDAADSLAMLLQQLGAESRTAYDGPTGLKAIQEFHPAAVFLDLGMPGMDGYAVAAEVRADLQNQDIMLIALTGWGQEEDKRRTQNAGFNAHLVKPPDPHVLRMILRKLPNTLER
ncbi:MAG: ATP-binding protein [Pirellulales bacterium]|nr:ATP-binding protein [Pirellulales bacterium]